MTLDQLAEPDGAGSEQEFRTMDRGRFTKGKSGNPVGRLAELLAHHDRDGDDRALFIECSRASGGWRCSMRKPVLLNQLQLCPSFVTEAKT